MLYPAVQQDAKPLLSSDVCPYNLLVLAHLDLHRDWLHNLQAAFIKWVKKIIPHDVRLQDVPALPPQHEERLVQLHGLVCGEGRRMKYMYTHSKGRLGLVVPQS